MKITLYIPKEANPEDIRSFLRSEVAEARNIKLKSTRKSVLAGLNKLIRNVRPGVGMFTDGEELVIEQYDGI